MVRRAGIVLLMSALIGVAPQAAAAEPAPAGRPAQLKQVTLITGDRVTVTAGRSAPAITPGPGRRKVAFGVTRVDGRLTVIPSDVRAQVSSGRLDRRLFDVTRLIESGYDDANSKAIPVIVKTSQAAKQVSGLAASRRLPVLGATAGKLDKRDPAAVLSASGVQKIWLDAKHELLLDKSVPQIGAPAAWQAGYTGKGVRVAVLDSGIDATHPDLASRVKGLKTFGDDQPGDQVGHGTHVASIIAGTGDRYRGVAPDAELYDGKVCTFVVCSESSIAAGMEWAATEVRAHVVNVSLGIPDGPELDPVEEAVNRLTEQTGTLFVVAAGNRGSSGSITSPGSAAAALTVGAVDRADQLAPFSSRGPVGDDAIKPEVTAPGVGIVAARSAQSGPGGDTHIAMSGTSMATPHTAGAAALLAQQHPDWRADELKSAVMATARPHPDLGPYEQGTGRIDVARAVSQPVVARPATISFGSASWPHHDDPPVTRPITYRNSGTAPVTLTLTAELTDPEGGAAPASALTFSARQVTVPAGGTATVQAISDTNHNGPDGRYLGRIVASAEGVSIPIPVVLTKDVEAYDLTIKVIGPDGIGPADVPVSIFSLDRPEESFLMTGEGGLLTRHVRAGEYTVDANVLAADGMYGMVQPSVQVTKDTTVVLDARQARPVSITVPRADARPAYLSADYRRTSADGKRQIEGFLTTIPGRTLFTLSQGPLVPKDQLSTVVLSQWGVPGPNEDYRDTPYLYRLASRIEGAIPTGYRRTVGPEELATIRTSLHRGAGSEFELHTRGRIDGIDFPFLPISFTAPASITEYVDTTAVEWSQQLFEYRTDGPVGPELATILTDGPRSYRAGATYRQRWNAVTYGPSNATATHTADALTITLTRLTDADGHTGDLSTDTESSRLYRDNHLLTETDVYGNLTAPTQPTGPATYRYETSMTRPTYSTLSNRIDYTTTFRSTPTQPPTLWTVTYRPPVDPHNTLKRTPLTTIPIFPTPTPATPFLPTSDPTPPTLTSLRVHYSPDNGTTWHPTTITRTSPTAYTATFPTPPEAHTISLRTTLTDSAGTTTQQTTHTAYYLQTPSSPTSS